jgi:hypothetical protein
MKKFSFLLPIILVVSTLQVKAQTQSVETKTPEFLQYENTKWVDSIMQTPFPG